MITLDELEQRIAKIEARNRKVELDKAWETSLTRRSLVAVFTYLAVGILMNAVGVDNPWLNAIVPTIGFLLSTFSIPLIKGVWLRYITRK